MIANLWTIIFTFINHNWKFGDITYSLYDLLIVSYLFGIIRRVMFVSQAPVEEGGKQGSESKNYRNAMSKKQSRPSSYKTGRSSSYKTGSFSNSK